MRLSLRQLTGNSQKKRNYGVFHKTGEEAVVLVNLKLLLHISIVYSHQSYINHISIIRTDARKLNITFITTHSSALEYTL